jgi:hypothetical protein
MRPAATLSFAARAKQSFVTRGSTPRVLSETSVTIVPRRYLTTHKSNDNVNESSRTVTKLDAKDQSLASAAQPATASPVAEEEGAMHKFFYNTKLGRLMKEYGITFFVVYQVVNWITIGGLTVLLLSPSMQHVNVGQLLVTWGLGPYIHDWLHLDVTTINPKAGALGTAW